jgi:hypothetical protein
MSAMNAAPRTFLLYTNQRVIVNYVSSLFIVRRRNLYQRPRDLVFKNFLINLGLIYETDDTHYSDLGQLYHLKRKGKS